MWWHVLGPAFVIGYGLWEDVGYVYDLPLTDLLHCERALLSNVSSKIKKIDQWVQNEPLPGPLATYHNVTRGTRKGKNFLGV